MQNSTERRQDPGDSGHETPLQPQSHGKRAIAKPARPTSSQLKPIAEQMARTTKRFLRSFEENLQLATVLALIAGSINAVGFLEFGTFVSHISGNATHAAIDYAESHKDLALIFTLEIACFIYGAFLTSFLLRGHTAAYSRIKYTLPVIIEAALLLLFTYFASKAPHSSGSLTYLLSLAMGMQNAMLRQTSGAIVRTTHMTGVATDIGIELGAALNAGLQLWRRNKKSKPILAFLSGFTQRLGLGRFAFQTVIFASFIAGGVLGTLGYHVYKVKVLLAPTLFLTLLGLREHLRPLSKT